MPQRRLVYDCLRSKLALFTLFLLIVMVLVFRYYMDGENKIIFPNEIAKVVSNKIAKIQVSAKEKETSPAVVQQKELEEKQEIKNPPTDPLEAIWTYVYKKKYSCSKQVYLGGKRENDPDGAYYICKDDVVWPFPSTKEAPCLVYSFGIDWDFKFDDEMAKLGCEVHSFDPSMKLAEGTKRKSGVIFHKIGISDTDSDSGFKGWKMRTLKTLMKELGHEDRALDYLKIDTDKGDGTGFEDTLMKELLDTELYKCVRQYAMEIHMPGPKASKKNMDRCKLLYSQLTLLEKKGFRLYETVDNIRYVRTLNPKATQENIRKSQFAGSGEIVLWENHFVNVDFEGKCTKYV